VKELARSYLTITKDVTRVTRLPLPPRAECWFSSTRELLYASAPFLVGHTDNREVFIFPP
jgi:hypothetical protein